MVLLLLCVTARTVYVSVNEEILNETGNLTECIRIEHYTDEHSGSKHEN